MKIGPLKRSRPKPVAYLRPGHRLLEVTVEDGTYRAAGGRDVALLLDKLTGYVCYADGGLSQFRYCTPATEWTLATWRGRETRIRHNASGVEVTSLRGTLEGSADPFGDLWACLHWLHGYGVAPGSLSAMAWNLWRASLAGPVVIGFDPDIGRAALYGGRQEVREPRTYSHMAAVDIRAAYPHAMAQAGDYALSLREVHPSTGLDPAVSGLAAATVHVPTDAPHAPLPVRVAPSVIQFQWGSMHGVWPWRELVAAEQLGAEVTVTRSWAPQRTADLFGNWYPMAAEGRELPGLAARMAKAITNSLWGQFGMVGDDRGEVRWADAGGQAPYHLALADRNMPHAWTAHIAAETTARVRARIASEALALATYAPVHIDTDGIIVRRSAPLPTPHGDAPGEWRVKDRMPKVDIRAPQLYRFTCGKGCGVSHAKWHHVASGMSAGTAPEYFRRHDHLTTRISYLAAFDRVLPPGHSDDLESRTHDLTELVGLGTD